MTSIALGVKALGSKQRDQALTGHKEQELPNQAVHPIAQTAGSG
jgi:hypothetical protein